MTEEAQKIVAWLRNRGDELSGHLHSHGRTRECIHIADAIERGDHLVWKPEPTIPASEWVKTPSVGH